MGQLSSSSVYLFLRSCLAILLNFHPPSVHPPALTKHFLQEVFLDVQDTHSCIFLSSLCFSCVHAAVLHFPQFATEFLQGQEGLPFSSFSGSTYLSSKIPTNGQTFRTKGEAHLPSHTFASLGFAKLSHSVEKWFSCLFKFFFFNSSISEAHLKETHILRKH